MPQTKSAPSKSAPSKNKAVAAALPAGETSAAPARNTSFAPRQNSLIPLNRPVIGRDLDEIKQQFGLSTADACYLFGLSITRWTQVVRARADEPLTDPTLALLVRLLADHPELSVIPKMPNANEMFNILEEIAPLDQKRFSILLGAEASAGYRWRKQQSRQGPFLTRLMYYMKMALLSRTPGDKAVLLDEWSKVVEAEGRARGVDDVFRKGQWAPREVIEQSKQSIGAKKGAAKSKASRPREMVSSPPAGKRVRRAA
jgi:hypothetical protein